jgi:sensor histidine kinase YesM
MIRIILFFLLLYSGTLLSQKYSFIEYSTRNGLPQSQVNSIAQDSSGYLWIGTLGGLSKFDGNEFVSYGTSDGLLNNRIIYTDFIGSKLFVGHDKGVSYSCERDQFCAISFPENIAPNNVTEIIKFKGEIYIGTNGSGIFRLDLNNQKLISVNNSPARIRGITVFKEQLILATRNGVFTSSNGIDFNPIRKTKAHSFSSILVKDNRLLATTYGGLLLKLSLNGITDTLFHKPSDPFRSVTVDQADRLWINSRNGVIALQHNKVLSLSTKNGLPINDINLTFQDREGNIWLGTGGKGVVRFTGEVFTYFKKNDLIPSELIISMISDKDGNRWISTFDKGVYKVSDSIVQKADYITSTVWSMDSNGKYIVFGSNFGLHVYNGQKWKSYFKKDGLRADKIRGVKKFNDSSFLIGTSIGVCIFNADNGSFKSIGKGQKNLVNVRSFIIAEDEVYFAAQSGVFISSNDKIEKIYDFDASINCIERSRNGEIWIGTENGLFIAKDGKVKRKHLSEDNRNDYINFIKRIDQQFFVGTNDGLFELSNDSSTVFHYTINSGLIDLETNLNSSFYDRKTNQLWFGTAAGLMNMRLENRRSLFNQSKPKVQLSRINVNFNDIESSALEKELSIPYKNNNIVFQFDGIFLSNPAALYYQYYLTGFSNDWSPIMKNSDINFTNLPPGEYTLRFRALNNMNTFSDELTKSFSVLPPFYLTWWFYTFCSVALILTVIFIDRLRVNRLAQRNYQLRLEYENKLTKLEQQSLNASMNRHFIFNSLNSIQYYINSSDKQSANKYLSRFAKLIRKNLDSSHRKDGMVALRDEIERLRLYLDLESMRFKDRFEYEINLDPHVEPEMLKVPAMFLQPFVENSIIHGILPLKDKKGLIKINVTDHLEHIRIEIIDNGIGIEQSVYKKSEEDDHESQGMLITKGRIELLQKISAKSIEMIGPHQINENDNSISGTIVIFKLIKQYLE